MKAFENLTARHKRMIVVRVSIMARTPYSNEFSILEVVDSTPDNWHRGIGCLLERVEQTENAKVTQ